MSPLAWQTRLKGCVGAWGVAAVTSRAIQRPRPYNAGREPPMGLEPEPVDIYAANPSSQSKQTDGDQTAPPVALAAHGSTGIQALQFVLEGPCCRPFSCTPAPLHFLSYYALPNRAKSNTR